MILSVFFAVGCNGEEDDGDDVFIPENTFATDEIKEAQLMRDGNQIVLYEIFDFKIAIGYKDNSLELYPYHRTISWTLYTIPSTYLGGTSSYKHNYYYHEGKFSFELIGKVSEISQIKDKILISDDEITDDFRGGIFSGVTKRTYAIGPNHGYVVVHKTEDDNLQYIRIRVEDYTEDANGTIDSFIVQYQIF